VKAKGYELDGGDFCNIHRSIRVTDDIKAYGADSPDTKYGFEEEVRQSASDCADSYPNSHIVDQSMLLFRLCQ
jgi:hypothetical protein